MLEWTGTGKHSIFPHEVHEDLNPRSRQYMTSSDYQVLKFHLQSCSELHCTSSPAEFSNVLSELVRSHQGQSSNLYFLTLLIQSFNSSLDAFPHSLCENLVQFSGCSHTRHQQASNNKGTGLEQVPFRLYVQVTPGTKWFLHVPWVIRGQTWEVTWGLIIPYRVLHTLLFPCKPSLQIFLSIWFISPTDGVQFRSSPHLTAQDIWPQVWWNNYNINHWPLTWGDVITSALMSHLL